MEADDGLGRLSGTPLDDFFEPPSGASETQKRGPLAEAAI